MCVLSDLHVVRTAVISVLYVSDGRGLNTKVLMYIGVGSGLVLVTAIVVGVVVCCRRKSAQRSKKG